MNHNIFNLITAILLSVMIIIGWHHFYDKPRLKKIQDNAKIYQSTKKITNILSKTLESRDLEFTNVKRINIRTPMLSGSISTKGIRFDDLVLLKYQQDLSDNSKNVVLFSNNIDQQNYFAEFGFISKSLGFPNSETIWNCDSDELTPEKPIELFWINSDDVKFCVNISVDQNYLFTIRQTIKNSSKKSLSFQYYGLINRANEGNEKSTNILHQGPIGSINSRLKEISFDNIKDKKQEKFSQSVVDWIGITDKYWLSALIPDKMHQYNSSFNYKSYNGIKRYQVDFISPIQNLLSNDEITFIHRLFAGAKIVKLLDIYEKEYQISLFDRAIDFGWFYIITKPLFSTMSFFYDYVGNFGISILIVTVIVKLLMFTLASKSYRSMKKIKELQPELEAIKLLHSTNKMHMNQAVMELYKKKKVNPVAGCLPLIIQIPVFFSIYKVLYVTIEMRHAPFFGWIKDLSAPDPTSVFNLFGLFSFNLPGFLMVGAWPIIMAITMFLQQKMSPEPADPVQAKVMKFMPLIFLFMFNTFPVGLLIYWSWNNILSILQQHYINKLD